MRPNSILTTDKVYVPGDEDNADKGDIIGVYDLRIGDTDLGQLYVTEAKYTIAWPGNFDEFVYANDNASYFISKQRESDRKELNLSSTGCDTRVSLLVLHEVEKAGESRKVVKLQRFRFASFETPKDYRELLELYGEARFARNVTFARYDFECNFEVGVPPARYAFSSENPEIKSKANGEMTVLLPRTHPLAKGLLREWIAHKHIHSRELRHALREPAVYSDTYHDLMDIALTKKIWWK